MQSSFHFVLDGESVPVSGDPARATLADLLPKRFDWQGAPLLMIDSDAQGRPVLRSIDPTAMRLPAAAGREFWSASGIPHDHPSTIALASRPGIATTPLARDWAAVMLAEAWHRADPANSVASLDSQWGGWPSRAIDFAAVRDLAGQIALHPERNRPAAPFSAALSRPLAPLDEFAYVDGGKQRFYRPDTRSEAAKLHAQYPNGTCEIALDAMAELRMAHEKPERWELGAALSLTASAEAIATAFPALFSAIHAFSHRARRNTITLGECLEPLAPALMALDASIRAVSADGERDIPMARYFTAQSGNHLRPNEFAAMVILPCFKPTPEKPRGAVVRLSDCLSAPGIQAGFTVECDREARVTRALFAYGGVAARPVRARGTEKALTGEPWTEESVLGILPDLCAEMDTCLATDGIPERDLEYRRQLVVTLLQKFFNEQSTRAVSEQNR